MKIARQINGKYKVLNPIPSIYKQDGNTYINFNNASIELYNKLGYKELINPEYDNLTQYLGKIIEGENNTYTYEVLDRPPIVIDPIANFNTKQAKEDIQELFKPRFLELVKYYSPISDNLNGSCDTKNFGNLKDFSMLYKANGIITNTEYEDFLNIFLKQDINLLEHPIN